MGKKLITGLLTMRYKVCTCEDGQMGVWEVTAEDLVSEGLEYEFVYAMRDEILTSGNILSLRVNEAMYFSPNRDNTSTKGIILRIE